MKCPCGQETQDDTEVCDYCFIEALEAIWDRPFLLEQAEELKKKYIKGANNKSSDNTS